MNLEMCLSSALGGLCAILMKSVTYTSIIHLTSCSIHVLNCRSVLSFVVVCFSSGCSGVITIFVLSISLLMHIAVPDEAQKYAGYLLHLI